MRWVHELTLNLRVVWVRWVYVLTLNLRVVPGCCAAALNPDPPNREAVAPPNGLDAVLVEPNRPPELVLVPKSV